MKPEQPELRRFGYPWVPLLFGLLATAVTVGILIGQWNNAWRGLLILLAGMVIFRVCLQRRGVED